MLTLLAIVTIDAFYSLGRTKATYDRFLDVNERLVEGTSESRSELWLRPLLTAGAPRTVLQPITMFLRSTREEQK